MKEYRNRELWRNVPLWVAAGAFAGYKFDKWNNYGRSTKGQTVAAVIVGATISGFVGASLVMNKINKIGK